MRSTASFSVDQPSRAMSTAILSAAGGRALPVAGLQHVELAALTVNSMSCMSR
jgi:hypothetical protein